MKPLTAGFMIISKNIMIPMNALIRSNTSVTTSLTFTVL